MWKISLAALLSLLSLSCATEPLPAWHGKIYQASVEFLPETNGGFSVSRPALVRRQANEIIYTDEPAFQDFMAMHWGDFRSFVQTFVFSCKAWDERAPFTVEEIKAFLKSLENKP